MTLKVYDHKHRWPEKVFDMPEANAVRDGGNEITVMGNDYRDGLNISIKNNDFSVDITHKTAEMLIEALLSNGEAEYLLQDSVRSRLQWGGVNYPNLWQSLVEEMA
jgi:hypothetical protein